MQAGFRADQVQVAGRYVDYARTSDEQDRKVHVFHFCPECGGSVFYTEPDEDDLVVVAVGAFGTRGSPRRPSRATGRGGTGGSTCPRASPATKYGLRFSRSMKPASTPRWPTAGERWSPNILEDPTLLYNLACCESLAGRPGDAIEHLRAAIDLREEFRPMAAEDSDFDPIRDQAFRDLVG